MQLFQKENPAFALFFLLRPSQTETLLLQSCLLKGEALEVAWEKFQGHSNLPTEFFKVEKQGLKRLLPLLYKNLLANNFKLDKKFQTVLRTAQVREELRSKTFQNVFRKTLHSLKNSNFPYTLLKGTLLAETIYSDWSLRHCHDIDILVARSHLVAAERMLKNAGYERPEGARPISNNDVTVCHHSNLPIEIHSDLFPVHFYQPPMHDLLERRRSVNIAGVELPVFSPTDNLYHVIGHAACSRSRETLRWICDAHMIIEKQQIDWDLFLSLILQSKMSIPFGIFLNYLKDEFAAPIPEKVIKQVGFTAACAGRAELEAAFTCLRMGSNGNVQNLLDHANDEKLRKRLIKWLMFPSMDCLRWSYDIEQRWVTPFYYFYRPFKFFSDSLPKMPRFKITHG